MTSNQALPAKAIVAGIDGTGPAHSALLWAAREAVARDLPLVVCHAYSPPDLEPDAEMACSRRNRARRLVVDEGRAAEQAVPGVDVYPQAAPGSISQVLLGAVPDPELFVLGCHRRQESRHQVADRLLDSTVGAGSVRPVVVVQVQAHPRRGKPGAPVVLALDGIGTAEVTGAFALTAAAVRGTRVLVVPAARPYPGSLASALLTLERLARSRPDVPIAVLDDIPLGGPVARLIRAADRAGLLVGPSGVGQLLGSRLARMAISRAKCPVALVPDRTLSGERGVG